MLGLGIRGGAPDSTTWSNRPGAVAGMTAPLAVTSPVICCTIAPPPPNWTSTVGMVMGVSAVP